MNHRPEVQCTECPNNIIHNPFNSDKFDIGQKWQKESTDITNSRALPLVWLKIMACESLCPEAGQKF